MYICIYIHDSAEIFMISLLFLNYFKQFSAATFAQNGLDFFASRLASLSPVHSASMVRLFSLKDTVEQSRGLHAETYLNSVACQDFSSCLSSVSQLMHDH